jgi:signal transduction histidine kinase
MFLPLILITTIAFIAILFLLWFFILRKRNPYSKNSFKALWDIEKVVLETTEYNEATQKVVDIILDQLGYLKYGYQVIVLGLIDHENNTLKRIAISHTDAASEFLKASPVPFQNITIPLDSKENILVKAINEKKMFSSSKVSDVLYPALPREWVNDFQKFLGIKSTLAFPVMAKDKVLGAIIFSLNKNTSKIKDSEWTILDSFVGAVGIALDNAILFKNLEESKKRELDKANELLRLKDEFVFVAVHDLKNPVTAIDGYISMINENIEKLDKDTKENLEGIVELNSRLKQLVNDLLQVARAESQTVKVNFKNVNIVDLIEKIVKQVTPSASLKKVSINTNLDKSHKTVLADDLKLKEVIENLLSNAIKYNKEGGKINVKTKALDSHLEISVGDTGYGIPKDQQGKVFQKFFRARQKDTYDVPGTGLGLFVVRMLVEKMNGKITFISEEGKGTTFIFTLPLAIN